jgi:hypothetical protein
MDMAQLITGFVDIGNRGEDGRHDTQTIIYLKKVGLTQT